LPVLEAVADPPPPASPDGGAPQALPPIAAAKTVTSLSRDCPVAEGVPGPRSAAITAVPALATSNVGVGFQRPKHAGRCAWSPADRPARGSKIAADELSARHGSPLRNNREEDRNERQRRDQGRCRFRKGRNERTRQRLRKASERPKKVATCETKGWRTARPRRPPSLAPVTQKSDPEGRPCECGYGRSWE
jgi:hypothetical protein